MLWSHRHLRALCPRRAVCRRVKAYGMNGAHRIQEIKYFRGGATLVFSLDGLQNNWLSERGRGDGGRRCIKKRDEELQFWIPPGGASQADEEAHPITCLCIRGQRGTTSPWGNNWTKPPPPCSAPPQHCCLLGQSQPFHHSTVTSAASFTNTLVFEAPWTRIIFRKRDIFSWFSEDLKVATQRDIVTMDQREVFIILCDEDCSMPPELLGDIYYKEDGGKTNGIISCRVNDTSDASGDVARPPPGPRVDRSEGRQPQTVTADSFNTLNLKSLLKPSGSCESPGRDGGGVKRKCVSFVDDVTVYLFDQESPTMELHPPEGCPSPPCSFPYALPDLTVDDSGFEWEDDFSALDWAKRNCHQCVTHSGPRELPVSHRSGPPALPSRSRTFFLSQTCLFLTYVTESDLEL